MTDKPKHVFLIDGSGFIFRAFHALPPMNRPDGTPTNAVYGFTTMLMKVIQDMEADHVAVIFDSERKTFRNDIYPDYKAHRPPPPEDLVPQFPLIREATRALNVACVEMPGFEADDLIATYARQAREQGAEVTIVSSDKDLMQLVGDGTNLFDAMKERVIDAEAVRDKFGVAPDKVVDVQALAGDSSDNVPGVPGIGVKTAAQLIEEYGDLETLLQRADEIKQPKRRQNLQDYAEQARISRRLVELVADADVPEPLADFVVREPDYDTLLAFLREQAFKTLVSRVEGKARADGHDTGEEPRETEYSLVRDLDTLTQWIDAARAAGVVAVDTETTSTNAMRARLVGFSLCVAPGRACYVPLAHKESADQGAFDFGETDGGKRIKGQVDARKALQLLAELMADDSVLKVGHNIKYDMQVLAGEGISVAPVDDTMVLSYVLESGLHGHGMDELARLHFGHETIKFKDVAGSGKAQVTFDRVALETARDYAAEDADITLQLHRSLKPRLVTEHLATVYETMERPLIPVLEAMERRGIKVDAGALKDLSADFARRLGDLEGEIHDLAGRQFNVGSPKQLGEILFDEMGLEGGKKGKSGAYSTGADVLEDLAAQGHALPQKVLDWRQLAKLKSTYADALLEDINPDTGRIHTSFQMTVTSTGRLSSSDPNLQNIPIRTEEGRKIRRAFVPEKGYRLLSADYSQIELRLLAHVAGIKALQQAFRDGQDIHALTASQVFGVALDDMDGATRRKAKAINFGIIYGISAFGLARQLGIGRKEAGQYIDAYFDKYPGIRDYMDSTKAFAKEHGFVTTLFGRRCHVRDLQAKNPSALGFAERAAINAPIQGGAADIIKRAMVKVPAALAEASLGARMLLQVHDELVFEVPEAEVEATAARVKEVMEGAARLNVPLTVEVGSGTDWEAAH